MVPLHCEPHDGHWPPPHPGQDTASPAQLFWSSDPQWSVPAAELQLPVLQTSCQKLPAEQHLNIFLEFPKQQTEILFQHPSACVLHQEVSMGAKQTGLAWEIALLCNPVSEWVG